MRDARPAATNSVEIHRRLAAVLRSASQSPDLRVRETVREFAEDESDPGLYLASLTPEQLLPANLDDRSRRELVRVG